MEEEGEYEGGMERESRGRREMRIGNLGEGRKVKEEWRKRGREKDSGRETKGRGKGEEGIREGKDGT